MDERRPPAKARTTQAAVNPSEDVKPDGPPVRHAAGQSFFRAPANSTQHLPRVPLPGAVPPGLHRRASGRRAASGGSESTPRPADTVKPERSAAGPDPAAAAAETRDASPAQGAVEFPHSRPASDARTSTAGLAPASPTVSGHRASWIASVPQPRLVRGAITSHVQITDVSCEPLPDTPQAALGITYWFDAKPTGEPYTMNVRLSGRLTTGSQPSTGATTFEVTSSVADVLPGSGRVAVTTRVLDLAPGEWEVTAIPVEAAPEATGARWAEVRGPGLIRGGTRGHTGFAALVQNIAPGVRLGVWPVAVGIGFTVALVLQFVLAQRWELPSASVLVVTSAASTLGLVGAKVYYLLTHRTETRSLITTGLSVQGFVITTVSALAVGALAMRLPLGVVLDATAPGLLAAAAIGRLGCLFAGCCVGKPTASRWGLWSSDRRVGVRRIPVQLLDSAVSAVIAVLALMAVTVLEEGGDGFVLAAALASYVLARQILFPLRSIPRATNHGRTAASILASAILLGSVTGMIVS